MMKIMLLSGIASLQGAGLVYGAEKSSDGLEIAVQAATKTVIDTWVDFMGHLPFLVIGGIVLLLTWGGAALVDKFALRLLKSANLRGSLKLLISRFFVIGVWGVGIIVAAMIIFPGLTPTKALGTLGIASVAIGFAFRDIFENFLAGILLLWQFPFENGDYIECEDILGRVEDVSIRMTQIRKTNDELVVLPNSLLFKNPVRILTNRPTRRVTVITGIAYGENIEEAVDIITRAVKKCVSVDKQHPVQIFPQAFGSSSIDIEVTWWCGATPFDIRSSRGEVITAVKKALDDANIEIPFPYRTLTFKDPLRLNKIEDESSDRR